jgi:mono/diheme cytochrome c family protein
MRAKIILSLFAITAIGGALHCSGGGDDETADPGSPKGQFATKVFPLVNPTCGDCHRTGKAGAPVFLGGNADQSYTAIEGFPGLISPPNVSPLMQKGPHSGPALTSNQSAAITEWLKAESIARKLSLTDTTPRNLRAAFAAFGKCMDYNDWVAKGLDQIAKTDTDNNQGQCQSCHNRGQGSMWWSANSAETFLKMKEFPYVQRLVIGRVKEDGTFDRIEASNRILDKGNEAQQQQANNHPRFSLAADKSANLREYVTQTLYKATSGQCDNVSLPDAGVDASP